MGRNDPRQLAATNLEQINNQSSFDKT